MTRLSQLTQIAQEHRGVDSLDLRNTNRPDFHEAAAARKALEAAYDLGRAELLAAAEALLTAKDAGMLTVLEWRRLRRAVRRGRTPKS